MFPAVLSGLNVLGLGVHMFSNSEVNCTMLHWHLTSHFFFSEIKTDSWLVCVQNVHKQLLHLSVLLSFCHCNLVEWKLLLFCFANLQLHFVGLLLFTRIQFLPRNNLLLPHQGLDQSLMIHVRILGRKEVVLEMFPGHLWLHKGCKHKQVFLCSLTTSYSFRSKL